MDGSHDEQVTRAGGYVAFEAAGGLFIYDTKDGSPGLFKRTLDGRETRIADLPQCMGYWSLTPEGAYLVDANAEHGPRLEFLRFADDRLLSLRTLPGEVACGETGLAATPDGRQLAYVAVSRGSDLVLLDKFY